MPGQPVKILITRKSLHVWKGMRGTITGWSPIGAWVQIGVRSVFLFVDEYQVMEEEQAATR